MPRVKVRRDAPYECCPGTTVAYWFPKFSKIVDPNAARDRRDLRTTLEDRSSVQGDADFTRAVRLPGLEQNRDRAAPAPVLRSHQTLTHQATTDEGAQAQQKNTEVVVPSLTQRIEAFRRSVNHDRIQHLLSRLRDPKLNRKLRQYLTLEAAVAA